MDKDVATFPTIYFNQHREGLNIVNGVERIVLVADTYVEVVKDGVSYMVRVRDKVIMPGEMKDFEIV